MSLLFNQDKIDYTFDFTKSNITKKNYLNLDYGENPGSIFLNCDDVKSILQDKTLITNIYSAVYNNFNLDLPGSENYYISEPNNMYNNWGYFSIPILNKDNRSFDKFFPIAIVNSWFLLCDDFCINNNPLQTLSTCSNDTNLQKWLTNGSNMENPDPPFNIFNLKIAFTDNTQEWNTGIPNIFSVKDNKGINYCICVFEPISQNKQITSTFVIDSQYSNIRYDNNYKFINKCDNTNPSFPDIIFVGGLPTNDSICWINDNYECPLITSSGDLHFQLSFTIPDQLTLQDCFNFIKPNNYNTYFSRGILDNGVCKFMDYTKDANKSYYTLDQYLLINGNIDIPDMLNLNNLVYADNQISGKVTKNNNTAICHSNNNWKNGLNIMNANANQTIVNIDTRTIRVGGNSNDNCSVLNNNNDNLYGKINSDYVSLSDIGNNLSNAWNISTDKKLNGLIYNGKTIKLGDNFPITNPDTGNTLYGLIDSDLFNIDGTIKNTSLFLTSDDNTLFPNKDQDWTNPNDSSYQKVYTTRPTDRLDPYYFNVAEKWKNVNGQPFVIESNFSNYYNSDKFNFCANGEGSDTSANPQDYDNNSLFKDSSLVDSFSTGNTLWRCYCPNGDSYSDTGYCISPKKYWWYKTETMETTSNSISWSQGQMYEKYIPDKSQQTYKRIIYLLGPQADIPDTSWLQVKDKDNYLISNNLYDAINALSSPNIGNLPSDGGSSGEDNGIICPAPLQTDKEGNVILRSFSFSNQLTNKGGSTNDFVTQSDIINSVPDQMCKSFGLDSGCAEVGGFGFPRFLIDSASGNYNSPGNSTIQNSNVYTCSNNILNGGSTSSSFPGSLFYEDFYNSSCPGATNQNCGTGPYSVNNSSGKSFPYLNQQSIPVATQNIMLVIQDQVDSKFYPPDSVEYTTTTGHNFNYTRNTYFPSLYDIPGFVSEPNVVCARTDIPWATGILGSNTDYNNNYIPSCFNVGYPLSEVAKLDLDGKSYIPTTINDNMYNVTADQGLIKITYGDNTAYIKNDLSIMRSNTDINNQSSSCFTKDFKLILDDTGNPLKFQPQIINNIITIGDSSDGMLNNKMKGVTSPCYNTSYNDNVVRMNLSNYQMYSGNTLYLVISFNNGDMNIKSGYYTLLTIPN